MIPTYQEFMQPLLEIARNGREIKVRDAIKTLADQYNLTPEERVEKLPSGRVTVLDNRVGWAKRISPNLVCLNQHDVLIL